MKNIRLVLFIFLVLIVIAIIGVTLYQSILGITNSPDHAVPYRNNAMPGPEGYSWKDRSDMGFKILVPDNWYWDEANVNKEEYYISKISWEETPIFITGIIISVYRDNMFPEIQSRIYAEHLLYGPLTEKLISNTVSRSGLATIKEIRTQETDTNFPDGDPRKDKLNHYRFISRPDLHILYIVRFECPVGDWPVEWEKGQVLLDSFTIVNK